MTGHPAKNQLIFTSNVITLIKMNRDLVHSGMAIRFSGRFAVIYTLIAAGLGLWCIGFIAAPRLIESGGVQSMTAIMLRYFYSFICHQNPDRSFHFMGHALAVCARCTGIYFGMLLGGLSFPVTGTWLHKNRAWIKWGCLAIAANLIEYAMSVLGIMESLFLRAGTGLILGFWIACFALMAIYSQTQMHIKWGDST